MVKDVLNFVVVGAFLALFLGLGELYQPMSDALSDAPVTGEPAPMSEEEEIRAVDAALETLWREFWREEAPQLDWSKEAAFAVLARQRDWELLVAELLLEDGWNAARIEELVAEGHGSWKIYSFRQSWWSAVNEATAWAVTEDKKLQATVPPVDLSGV